MGGTQAAIGQPRWVLTDRVPRELPRRAPGGVRHLWWVPALVAACALAANARDHGPDGPLVPWYAAALTLVAMTPAALRSLAVARGHQTRGPIPFMPLVGLCYAVYYALPVLATDAPTFMYRQVGAEHLERATRIALTGVVALLFGYYAVGRALRFGRRIDLQWDPRRAVVASLLALPFGLVLELSLRVVSFPPALARPIDLLGQLLPLSIGALVLLARAGHLPRWVALVAWGVFAPAYSLLEASDGVIGSMVWSFSFFAMLRWGGGLRMPVALIAAAVPLIALMRVAGHEYRQMEGTRGAVTTGTVSDRVGAMLDQTRTVYEEQGVVTPMVLLLDRLGQIVLFAWVVERSPAPVPHWGATTLSTLPATLIPRALWPNKPEKKVGYRFGRRYGVIEHDSKTTINLPQLVEWFVAYGSFGVLFGMTAIGAFYRRLDDLLNYHGASDANVLLAAAVLSPLLQIESDSSMIFGGIMQTGVVLYVLMWLVKPRAGAAG
ncbi:MAG: hypothetical protein AAFZ65_07715 [Planctomycetota bacterium]